MSVSSGIRPRPNPDKTAAENTLLSDQQFVQRMKPFNAESPATGFVGTGTVGGSAPVGGSFLQDATAAVTGAFGLFQTQIQLELEQIHISLQDFDEHWSSFIELTNAATDGILDLIDAGDYSGQIMKIRIPDGVSDFVINNANKVGNDTGNILMAGVENLKVQGGEILEFIFDVFTVPQAVAQSNLKSGTLSGVWRLSSGVSAPGAEVALAILGLTVDQVLPVVIDWDENFIFGDDTKIIDRTATNPGVFQLVGDVFNLEALLSIEMDTAGQGTEALLAWEESTTVSGTYNIIPNPRARAGVYNGGRAAFSTQPHATALVDATSADVFVRVAINEVVGTVLSVLNAASTGSIQTVGGGGGSGGGGGNGLTNPLTENLDLDGYNLIMDEAGLSFWRNSRELENNWTQLLLDDTIALNISNRVGQQWVRSGFNLEPNSTQSLGSLNQRWDEVYVDNFMDFDGATIGQPGTGDGRIFWNQSTKSFHQIDDAGTDTDLVGSASDVSQWANFPAVNDVIPDTPFRLLGNTGTGNQWGGLFMDTSTSIRWETSTGVFTETTLQGTTGGFIQNVGAGGSHSFREANIEQFKIDIGSVSINTPTLDFNNIAATIEGIRNINYFDGGSIINVSSIPGLGNQHMVYDTQGTIPAHLFTVSGDAYLRIVNDGNRTVDFRPLSPDPPTGIKHIRSIRFLETSTPSITSAEAMITATPSADMFLNVADGQSFDFSYNAIDHQIFSENGISLVNGVGAFFSIVNTVGSGFSINKSSTFPVEMVCNDGFDFTNLAAGIQFDLRGDLNSGNTVPSQLFFSGKNSVGSYHEYAKIKARIQDPLSGAESGDLELYGSVDGSEHEFITMKARDPFTPNNPVIYVRDNVEFLSNLDADRLILNEARIEMSKRTTNVNPINQTDAVLYLFDAGSGVTQLKIRFASGPNTEKIIADNQ